MWCRCVLEAQRNLFQRARTRHNDVRYNYIHRQPAPEAPPAALSAPEDLVDLSRPAGLNRRSTTRIVPFIPAVY